MKQLIRGSCALILGVSTATLIACGGSGKGLIPVASAGPLQSDFEAVAQAAQNANGDCTATIQAIEKTERDLHALPGSVDSGLHNRLQEGTANLRVRALALCEQPLAPTTTAQTTTSTKTTTTPTTTTPTTSTTTPTTTTPTTSTTTPTDTTPPPPGGGTQAPGEEEGEVSEPSGAGSSGGTSQGAGQ